MNARICVIGAGPAGLFAAISAAEKGARVCVIEKNTTPGRKLLLTGGRRCNLTHTGDVAEFVYRYGKAGRFLRHALHTFSPQDLTAFFASRGLGTKTFSDGCIFPVTERASDVRDLLVEQAKELAVTFLFDKPATQVARISGKFEVRTTGPKVNADKLIIATGGLSYPRTGSTGDGYKFAASLGHTIVKPRGILVPLISEETWPADLTGTSLLNVTIHEKQSKFSSSGPMLFTNDGIAGPVAQDFSRIVAEKLLAASRIQIAIDLLPDTSTTEFDKKLVSLFAENPRKTAVNVLSLLLPRRLAANLFARIGISDDTWASKVTKQQRRALCSLLKTLPLTITGTRPIEEATVTAGGVPLDEIDGKTMQSEICPRLFFAGEVIDADGPCGGYNLQIAFSTGFLAGLSAAAR